MEQAKRIQGLTSAIFTEMGALKKKVEARGVNVINLGVGSPDLPPAPHIIQALHQAIDKPQNYQYPMDGLPELRQALAGWYKTRFNVVLDPETEIMILMGSQDGLAHIALAYINPGDIALVPDPGYPIYSASIILAQGEIYPMPLLEKNSFLPDLEAIPEEIARRAKMMTLNYPNNPVAVSANREFFEKVVSFAKKFDVVVCHDVAYAQLAYDGLKPMSFLEVAGAKEVGIEFYSLSKTYNMAGCRIGFAVGNAEILEALGRIKSNIDYGVFKAVQEAGIAALTGPQDCVAKTAATYQRRRDILVDGLAGIGWHMPKPKSSMFIWAPLPQGYRSSKDFAFGLLEETGVLVIPGIAFGEQGEGYVRIAMVQPDQVLQTVVERIKQKFKFT